MEDKKSFITEIESVLTEQKDDQKKKRKPRLPHYRHAKLLTEIGYLGSIRFNSLTQTIELHHDDKIVAWSDALTAEIAMQIETRLQRPVSIPTLSQVILSTSRRNAYDPIIDWIGKQQWDGTPRIDSWLKQYLSAEEDSEYCAEVGRIVMLSMVGRALTPGVKVDQMMVLRGPQGCGKSTVCLILAPWPELYNDAMPDIRSKDAEIVLERIVIQELAELAAVWRSDLEVLKAFITRRECLLRRPYDRWPVTVLRRAIFIGTTNSDVYLIDPTGNRRFLPVTVGKIDLDGLQAVVPQLWAEAAHRLGSGEDWLYRGQQEVMSQVLESVTSIDEWESLIASGLAGGKAVKTRGGILTTRWTTVGHVLSEILEIEPARYGRSEQMRVASILRRLGLAKDKQLRLDDGTIIRPWILPQSD